MISNLDSKINLLPTAGMGGSKIGESPKGSRNSRKDSDKTLNGGGGKQKDVTKSK